MVPTSNLLEEKLHNIVYKRCKTRPNRYLHVPTELKKQKLPSFLNILLLLCLQILQSQLSRGFGKKRLDEVHWMNLKELSTVYNIHSIYFIFTSLRDSRFNLRDSPFNTYFSRTGRLDSLKQKASFKNTGLRLLSDLRFRIQLFCSNFVAMFHKNCKSHFIIIEGHVFVDFRFYIKI